MCEPESQAQEKYVNMVRRKYENNKQNPHGQNFPAMAVHTCAPPTTGGYTVPLSQQSAAGRPQGASVPLRASASSVDSDADGVLSCKQVELRMPQQHRYPCPESSVCPFWLCSEQLIAGIAAAALCRRVRLQGCCMCPAPAGLVRRLEKGHARPKSPGSQRA